MPLETATFIHQLEASNPAGSDQLAQGDDHLRMLKAVIKATFPNITGPVTKTQAELNSSDFVMPIGVISMWFGSSGTIPAGWALCNGQTVSRTDGAGTITTPDLRDRVVIGAGTIAAQGTTTGADTANANTGSAGAHTHTVSGGAHTHTGEVQGTALTVAQMPAHTHGNGVSDDNAGNIFPLGSRAITTGGNVDTAAGSGSLQGNTTSEGSGQTHAHGLVINESTHTHTVSDHTGHSHSVAMSTIQPSYGLHYIMKV